MPKREEPVTLIPLVAIATAPPSRAVLQGGQIMSQTQGRQLCWGQPQGRQDPLPGG